MEKTFNDKEMAFLKALSNTRSKQEGASYNPFGEIKVDKELLQKHIKDHEKKFEMTNITIKTDDITPPQISIGRQGLKDYLDALGKDISKKELIAYMDMLGKKGYDLPAFTKTK